MREKTTLIKKVAHIFGMCCVCLSLCCGLIACSNGNNGNNSNDDPEKGSGFEDVIPTPPESDFSVEASEGYSNEDSDEVSDEYSEEASGEYSEEESNEESEEESDAEPEGDISAGDPNPDYGNGDIPF